MESNVKITKIENNLTEEEKEKNLRHLYDVINDIAETLFNKNIDVSKYFYTAEEIEEIKKKQKLC